MYKRENSFKTDRHLAEATEGSIFEENKGRNGKKKPGLLGAVVPLCLSGS